MNKETDNRERGQSLILMAVLMIVFIGILMLAIDGGTAFSKRRSAQNAADAGALAGARTLCVEGDVGQADFMARQYATVHNEAVGAIADVDVDTGTVAVTTTIPFATTFAHFFGTDSVTAGASAEASCCPATFGVGVLPIAWACRPPIPGYILGSFSDDCQELALEYPQVLDRVNNPLPLGQIYPELYMVMDSNSTPDDLAEICQSEGGWLDCDLDNDGDDDLIANGGRSWLDLDGGGGGASEMVAWVRDGFPGTVNPHTWVGGQPGVDNTVFQNVEDYQVGNIVAVPVFDQICNDYPDPTCASLIHPNADDSATDVILTSAGGNYFYHIITFAAFYVSCVHAPPLTATCPGQYAAEAAGVVAHNTKMIEGYFVTGVLPNLGGGNCGGIDLGAYTLTLER